MSNSLSFNGTDLSSYELIVISRTSSEFSQEVGYTQLLDAAYPFGATRTAKPIRLRVVVTGTSYADIEDNLDSIKRVLNERDSKHLILDTQDDRYFKAQFISLSGQYQSPTSFAGELSFICTDPLAYDNDETFSPHDVDADPKTITEATGGSGFIKPVYTLKAGEELSDVTIKVENLDTVEELQWTGSLADGEELEIDVANWLVKKEGDASMATVTGQFPRLLPNYDNRIKVTSFSTTGTLNITYRDVYL